MGVHTTVVFTDLIGSTTAFEILGNAKATQVVTRLTRWIREVFESHGGRVIKTLGDGVLAVFPSSQNAIHAVVDLQRSYQKQTQQVPAPELMPIRVGVATGEVEIVDGDCYGDAVNVASRLNDLCGPHEIWVDSSELDVSAPSDHVRYRRLGPINVRGRAEPCTVYQVEWQEDEASEFLTRQADFEPLVRGASSDALGAEIELTWADQSKSFKSFDLPIQIGRVRQSEFVVNDPRVSRTHARIEWRNGSIVLVDVSSYGTWIRFEGGGADVLLRREECVLHGRGEIALGASFSDAQAPAVKFSIS
jgi:class 3 adenylate cyclase